MWADRGNRQAECASLHNLTCTGTYLHACTLVTQSLRHLPPCEILLYRQLQHLFSSDKLHYMHSCQSQERHTGHVSTRASSLPLEMHQCLFRSSPRHVRASHPSTCCPFDVSRNTATPPICRTGLPCVCPVTVASSVPRGHVMVVVQHAVPRIGHPTRLWGTTCYTKRHALLRIQVPCHATAKQGAGETTEPYSSFASKE